MGHYLGLIPVALLGIAIAFFFGSRMFHAVRARRARVAEETARQAARRAAILKGRPFLIVVKRRDGKSSPFEDELGRALINAGANLLSMSRQDRNLLWDGRWELAPKGAVTLVGSADHSDDGEQILVDSALYVLGEGGCVLALAGNSWQPTPKDEAVCQVLADIADALIRGGFEEAGATLAGAA